MRWAIGLSVLVLVSTVARSQDNGRGAKAIALGNSFAAVADDVWALAYNPAGLARQSGWECAAFTVPQQFGLAELRTDAVALLVPLLPFPLACSFDRFGFDLFRQVTLRCATALFLDRSTSVGITLNRIETIISRYGQKSAVTADVGLLSVPLAAVRFGCAFKNIGGATVVSGETFPQSISLASELDILDALSATVELEKDVRFPASVKFGIEQRLLASLALRAGVATNPDKFSLGFAVGSSPVEFAYAAYSHPDLGWTQQVEISFAVDK